MRDTAHQPQRHYGRHLRRRAQRAENEARALREALAAERADRAAERAALVAYLDGGALELDALEALQAVGRDAVREMAKRHQSCTHCGGYRREMWDALLEPEIRAQREALGWPERGRPAPDWPLREGYQYWGSLILRPFQTEAEREESERRGRALQAALSAPVSIGDY